MSSTHTHREHDKIHKNQTKQPWWWGGGGGGGGGWGWGWGRGRRLLSLSEDLWDFLGTAVFPAPRWEGENHFENNNNNG